jgi:drug/metabolite transporter (DMT)-like permease
MNTKSIAPALDWAGVALIVVSATAFASMAIFARHAYSTGANPLGLMITRFAIAAVLLVLLMIVLRRPFPKLDSRAFWVPLGMGAIGYAGQSMGYFTALQHAQAGTVALLLYLYPAIVALLAPVFLRERLTPIKLALLALSFVGMVLTIAPWQSATGQNTPFGVGLSLMNAMIYSVYLIVGGRFLANTDPYANATLVCIGTALSLFALSLFLRARQVGAAASQSRWSVL